ncbi:MAG TPA: arginine--tRNA ligase, partial [Blastocatellia bacterium]|nr:arginine--tRNA ligase [Blastocatellia bacterium]
MNGPSLQERIRTGLLQVVKNLFELELRELSAEVPPRTEMGDLAFPVAFDLAKKLKAATRQKQNPRDIAARIKAELDHQSIPGVSKMEVAGAGYINVFFDRAQYLLAATFPSVAETKPGSGKLIVEHTALNPNKAAHIGHVRNAVLGDTIVKMLEAAGEQVEIQNYIDNTGVQVADVVVGFKYLENKTLHEVKAIGGKFDYYCWDLYAQVGQFYEQDPTRHELRTKTLHELESGEGDTYQLADYVSTRILNHHLDTMFRVGVEYDVLPRESEVLHLHIWDHAFKLLKERGAIEYETEGKLAGCWVMRAADEEAASTAEPNEHEADKVIVRSNGTITYTGKDIAFHLWKLGQIDLDFYYKPFRTYPSGRIAWITTSDPNENISGHKPFGNGAAYFNVI